MKYIKKYWFPLLILLISIGRFIISYKLPSYYISNLKYDDNLMINQLDTLLNGNYLGKYTLFTLIKGPIFPILLYYSTLLHLSFSSFFTILFILSSLYFLTAIKDLVKNKYFLIFIYIILLFNPITYAAETFQRLYINTISITEILVFLSALLNVITSKKNSIIYYIILGTISSIMLLTRNDNIWIYIVLVILFIYKIYKNHSIKICIINIIPILLIILGYNVLSAINYKYYKVYSYNELEHSAFKTAYTKVTQIDNKKYDRVSINKDTLYKLSKYSKVFDFSKEEIDQYAQGFINTEDKEIDNGNSIWYFRILIYSKHKFKDGKEANNYFKNLSKDIDTLFKNGTLKKKTTLPSVFINTPSKNELLQFPTSLIKTIWYTSSYKNIRTFSNRELRKLDILHYNKSTYEAFYKNYRHSENMVKKNIWQYEVIRIIYKFFTLITSALALVIYLKNIRKKDKLNLFIHLLLIIYALILLGVVYTDVTAFYAIRYRYLANTYILQNFFIVLNIYRFIQNRNSKLSKKDGDTNAFNNNTHIQRRKNTAKNNSRIKKSTKRK